MIIILAKLLKISKPTVESPKATNVPHTTDTESVKITKTTQFQGNAATSFLKMSASVAVPILKHKHNQNNQGLPSK